MDRYVHVKVVKAGKSPIEFHCEVCGCVFTITQEYLRQYGNQAIPCPECGRPATYQPIEFQTNSNEPKMWERSM